MPELRAALDAFLQRHNCGDLDGGLEGQRIWMACDCGGIVVRLVQPVELACPDR